MINKYPRTIAVLLYTDEGVWLSKRKNRETFNGYWQAPGGKVDNNEDNITAALRELKEETGIVAKILKYEVTINDDPSTDQCIIYSLKLDNRVKPKHLEKETMDNWILFDFNTALKLKLMLGLSKIITDIKDNQIGTTNDIVIE